MTGVAVKFQASMARVHALVDVGGKAVLRFQHQILNLSKTVPVAPQALAEALFFVTSAGFRGKKALDILTAGAKASAIGLGDTEAIVRSLASAMNAYAGTGLTAEKATDAMIAAVREGHFPIEELGTVMGTVVGIAAEFGITFEEVLATVAATSRVGVPVSRTITGLRFLITSLAKPSEIAQKGLDKIGISAADLRKEIRDKGLLRTLTELHNRLPVEDFIRVTGGARGLVVALGLVGKNAAANRDVFNEVANSAGSLDTALERTSKTAQFKFKQALVNLQRVAIEVGSKLLPIFTKGVELIGKWAEKFADLSPRTQELIIKSAGLAIALGPVLRIMGGLLRLSGSLGGLFVRMGASMAGATGTVGLMTSSIAGPLGLIAALEGLVIFTDTGKQAFDSFVDFVLGKIPGIKDAMDALGLNGPPAPAGTHKAGTGPKAVADRGIRDILDSSVHAFKGAGELRNEAIRLEDIFLSLETSGKIRNFFFKNLSRQEREAGAALLVYQGRLKAAEAIVGGTWVDALIRGSDAEKMLAVRLIATNKLSTSQKSDIGDLIDTFTTMGGALTKAQKNTLLADIAAGRYKEAIALLRGEIKGIDGTLSAYTRRLQRIPKSARTDLKLYDAEARATIVKYRAFLYSQIPDQVHTELFVIPKSGFTTGAKGGIFAPARAAGGAVVGAGGHTFLAGEGGYPTQFGRGGELVNQNGVLPLTGAILDRIADSLSNRAAGGMNVAGLARAIQQALDGMAVEIDGYRVGKMRRMRAIRETGA